MSQVKRFSFNHSNCEYHCDLFGFLKETIPDKTMASNHNIRITCFDVSHSILVFGSSIGLVYGYKRRTRIMSDPHFKLTPANTSISYIQILSNELLLIATCSKVMLFNMVQRAAVWESKETFDKPINNITALRSLLDARTNIIHVLVGDASGKVIKCLLERQQSSYVSVLQQEIHDETSSQQSQQQQQQQSLEQRAETEEQAKIMHTHEIVQIEIISSSAYLISSCYRSIIVQLGDDKQQEPMIQIGRNQRKVCGKYGAIYNADQQVIYASRPSSHLIQSSLHSGQAIQTFILKRAERPPARKVFADLRKGYPAVHRSALTSSTSSTSSSPPAATVMQLGKLIQVNSHLLLSWTSRSLVLVTTEGSLVMDENSLLPVIDVSCLTSDSNEFEVFILFADRSFIRVRNIDIPIITSSSSSDEDPTMIGINRLLPHPLSFPVLSSFFDTFDLLPGDMSQLISGNEQKVSEFDENKTRVLNRNPVERQSPAALFTIDSNSHEDSGDQLLVTRKKVISKKSSDSSHRQRQRQRRESQDNVRRSRSSYTTSLPSLNVSRVSIFSNNTDDNRSTGGNSSTPSEGKDDVTLELEKLDENQKLQQILNAYKEQAGIPGIESGTESEATVATDETFVCQKNVDEIKNVYPPPDQKLERNAAQTHEGSEKDFTVSKLSESMNPVSIVDESKGMNEKLEADTVERDMSESSDRNDFESPRTLHLQLELRVSDVNDNQQSGRWKVALPVVPMKWVQRLPSKRDLHFDTASVVSISAFNDDMRDGLALLSTSTDVEPAAVNIFPGWKNIRCPYSKSIVKAIDINRKQVLILYQDGSLYRSSNWSRSRLFFGPRFERMEFSRTRSLISISVNTMDNICWSCDQEGVGWVIKLGSNPGSCMLARDDSSLEIRLNNIVVSPRNSAIVWATDDNQRLYCRAGIFNEKSDKDTLIAGINWVPVDDLPGQLLHLTASNDSVWIICRKEGIERLFKRIGINTPVDYIGSYWEQYELPVESGVEAISASSTGDLWIITNKHAVFQHCPHEGKRMKTVENGWLLV